MEHSEGCHTDWHPSSFKSVKPARLLNTACVVFIDSLKFIHSSLKTCSIVFFTLVIKNIELKLNSEAVL